MGCGTSKSKPAVTENRKSLAERSENNKAINNGSGPVPQEETALNWPENRDVSSFESEALAFHNKYRQRHHAFPLELDRKMCQEAAAYAKRLAREKQMKHSSSEERHGQGENLAMSGGSAGSGMTGKYASEMWYLEIKQYNFEKPGFSMGTGHFTQVVWKGTKQLGVGAANYEEDGMQCTVVVARYYPAGNVMGQFDENVLREDTNNN